jgi:hypothetical protein|tara:strand:+ start:445 stop:774 length:330 start_codon:yes stop_codon:yes gene_type:complete
MPARTLEYGKLNKRIVFTDNDHRHAQLLVRLRADGLSQADFFRAVVTAYIDSDTEFVKFVDKIKTHSIKRKHKSQKLRRSGATKTKDLGLNEGEIENIFDILAEEHPDL